MLDLCKHFLETEYITKKLKTDKSIKAFQEKKRLASV